MSTVDVFEKEGKPAHETGLRWPLHAGFAVALIGFCVCYAQTFVSLISIWASTGRYEYAFLIMPVSAVLAWLRRDTLKRLTAVPAPAGLGILAIFCLLWLVGAAADVNVITQFAVIAMIPCLVFTFYGTAITWALLFPLAYLFFALPVGNVLVGPLQDITARLSVAALQWTPVPVLLEGHFIMTPAGTWHVAEACSGVSFFFATTAFGALYAYLFFRSWRRRLLFVALALITPIIANGLRVFFTILIGEYFGMHYATGTDHMIFGWQFFGTVLVVLFLIGWPWHEPERPVAPPPQATVGKSRPITAAPIAVCALLVLVAAPLWFAAGATPATQAPVRAPQFPSAIGAMRLVTAGPANPSAALGTAYRHPDAGASVHYVDGQQVVNVTTAVYYGEPSAGNELVMFGNRLFDPSRWKVVSSREAAVDGFRALTLVRQQGRGRWLLWYAYRVGDRTVTSASAVKLWRAWDRLLGQPRLARVMVLAMPVTAASNSAAQRLKRVADELSPWLSGRSDGVTQGSANANG